MPTCAAPSRLRSALAVFALVFGSLGSVVACASVDDAEMDEEGLDEDVDEDDSEVVSSSEAALSSAGPCAGTAIERAVQCAIGKGARVLSLYRSPAEQERVRRQNGCRNRCTGQTGCVRPTAGCTTSPHTACRAVDLVSDGSPVTRAALRSCGLAKVRAPHRNHYDLVK